MKYFAFFVCFILMIFLSGCISEPHSTNITTGTTPLVTTPPASATPTPAGTTFIVHAVPERYSPMMSSTVGIGLTPDYSGPGPVDFRWQTNYGRFLLWNQTDGKITEYDLTAVTTGQVYWSFQPDETGMKPPVAVQVEAVNGTTGTPVASAIVYIGWEDDVTAVVIPAPCGVTNCHGPVITCGADIAEFCTQEYQIGDKCRSLAACRVRNGSCTVVEDPGYTACVSCSENCIITSSGDPVKAFDCESQC